jgi:hypothetical protein
VKQFTTAEIKNTWSYTSNGKFHAPVAFPQRQLPSAPIEQETGWNLELLWLFWRREKPSAPAENRATIIQLFILGTAPKCRAGLWVGRSGPLPRALTSRGRRKRQSPTGHTLIRSTVAWCFLIFKRKEWQSIFIFNLVVLVLAYSDVFTYVYSRYALCLLLQILLVAALDITYRFSFLCIMRTVCV